jgi:prefoldin subunit 5
MAEYAEICKELGHYYNAKRKLEASIEALEKKVDAMDRAVDVVNCVTDEEAKNEQN